jgi:hypothetical protein
MRSLLVTRRVVATLASLAAAVAMRAWDDDLPRALWIPSALLAASALLLHRRQLGAQLLVRAVWWANLMLGTLVAVTGSSGDRAVAAPLALATGAALLALGRHRLEEAGGCGSFVPIAFRSSLMATLVMAMADAQSLLLFGGLELERGFREWRHGSVPSLALGCAAVLALAIVGLYRLRLWGLLLNLAGTIAVAALGFVGKLDLPGVLVGGFVASAAVQVGLAAPILRALFTGAAPSPPRIARGGWAVGVALVLAMMGISAACAYALHHRLLPL